MEVPVQWLEATFERESVDLWICGGSVVMESEESWVVQGVRQGRGAHFP